MSDAQDDYWLSMRWFTSARIGIGRSGCAIPTNAVLDFQLAFARARDAVHAPLDGTGLALAMAPAHCLHVRSRAQDRASYLLRPDQGRLLSDDSAALVAESRVDAGFDLVFILADGLSAGATERYAPAVIDHCRAGLAHVSIAPPVIATQARVALGDHVGELLNARMAVILIGERPGLTAAESLGIYLTWHPRVGTLDSARNCISNVHDGGLRVRPAADMTVWLIREAMRLRLTGVGLKENSGQGALAAPTVPAGETD